MYLINHKIRGLVMSGKILLLWLILISFFPGVPEICAAMEIETKYLIIRETTGDLPQERFDKLASKVDSTMTEVLKFWSADPKIEELGKIVVEYNRPLQKDVTSSFFFYRKENNKLIRVVRVFGGNEYPHQLAHKLTTALFPNPDILIRNMMGEASEMRFGNPLSFPMCGFDKNEWIMALLQAGSYIPLAEIGPDQSDWGKEIVANVPKAKDRVKQHTCYLEAGSFGEFLIDTYGPNKMKQFYRLSKNKPRPWKEVFGTTLEQLEAKWLENIKLKSHEKMENISKLVKLWRINPHMACFSAQDLAKEK